MFDVDAPSFIGTYQHLHLSPLSNWFLAPSSVSTFQMPPTIILLALVNVQLSAAYNATVQTVLFIICLFCSQFTFPINNFFLSMNSVLPIAVLARMSLVAYRLSDIQLPKYSNWLACSTCWSSINRHTLLLAYLTFEQAVWIILKR